MSERGARDATPKNASVSKSMGFMSRRDEMYLRCGARPAALAFAFVLVLSATSGAGAEHACAAIADDMERLACYDREHGVERTPPAVDAVPNVEHERAPAPRVTAEAVAPASETAASVAKQEAPSAPAADSAGVARQETVPAVDSGVSRRSGAEAPKPSAADASADTAGIIANVRERWPDGRRVFTLEGGEQWVQTQARRVFINAGDRVTLKQRRFGQFLLVAEGGATTRVRRLDGE